MSTGQNSTGTSNFLNFSDALNHLRWGERIARRKWLPGEYIQMDYNGDRTTIFFHDEYCADDDWEPSPRMILAEDWYVV
jgi:hypothetical protein